MKRATLIGVALVTLTAIHALAAEPAAESKAVPKEKPSAKTPIDASEPLIPKRELTFEVSEEEITRPLSAPDPGLLEQRYVAIFRSESYSQRRRSPNSGYGMDPKLRFLHREVFSTGPQFGRVFHNVLDNIPQERMPAKDILDVLSAYLAPSRSAYYSHRVLQSGDPYDRKYYDYFELMAPTPQRAEELARGLLSLYDEGLFHPIQREILRLKRDSEQRLLGYRAALKEAEKELAVYEKLLEPLKEYEDISEETLVHFTTQMRLISVDLAGIRARIAACNKILRGTARSPNPSRWERIETVKITAEIEMVGAEARKAAIEEIVTKGKQQVELVGKVEAGSKKVSSRKSSVSSQERRIAELEAEKKNFMPFPIQDGKITIHPIKWVPPEKRE